TNAVLLARAGAQVEGVDISPGLIEVATRRAHAENLLPRVRFHCAPVERAQLPSDAFDVVWGDQILHHLADVLEPTLEKLCAWAKPGARFIFGEPVSLSALSRRLRRAHLATPDARPLEARELALVKRFLPDLQVRHFDLLGRLTPLMVAAGDEGALR